MSCHFHLRLDSDTKVNWQQPRRDVSEVLKINVAEEISTNSNVEMDWDYLKEDVDETGRNAQRNFSFWGDVYLTIVWILHIKW